MRERHIHPHPAVQQHQPYRAPLVALSWMSSSRSLLPGLSSRTWGGQRTRACVMGLHTDRGKKEKQTALFLTAPAHLLLRQLRPLHNFNDDGVIPIHPHLLVVRDGADVTVSQSGQAQLHLWVGDGEMIDCVQPFVASRRFSPPGIKVCFRQAACNGTPKQLPLTGWRSAHKR